MVIHAFGAYYGLSISWMLYRPQLDKSSRLQGSLYHSDVFTMIGGFGVQHKCYFYSQKYFVHFTIIYCGLCTHFTSKFNNALLSSQAHSSCGCSGPASTQPSRTMGTGNSEQSSTPTCLWVHQFSLLWPYQASSRRMVN